MHRPAIKCLALDCDDTLWGGVVGEKGVGGLQLGDEFPGNAFADFQRLVLQWKERGLLLALLSKNDEQDVWDVFEKHDGMILQRSDIAAWRINWEPKSEGLSAIAEELHIGIDSFAYVDDSTYEIGLMRAAHPSVRSIQVPEESADFVDMIKGLHLFNP